MSATLLQRRHNRIVVFRTLFLVGLIVCSAAVSGATVAAETTLPADSSAIDDFAGDRETETRPAVGGDQFAGDWPTAGHDSARTGTNQNSSGPKTNPDARWIYEFANDDWSVPAVVADGLVFVAGYETLRAVDNETGAAVWNVTGLDNYDEILAGNGVVVTTERGYGGEIHAYHATNGTEIWNKTSSGADASVVLNGMLYVARGEYLYAFDLQTGTEQWSVDVNEDISLALSASGDTLYATGKVNDRDYGVYALNASDGSERWRFEIEGIVSMRPVISNGSVFIGGGSEQRDQTDGAWDPKFYRLNATDGHVEWVFDVNTRPHGAAVADGVVYLASGNTVHALDVATGERQWLHRLAGSITYGVHYYRIDARPPVVADGVVYALNDRGHMVALDGTTGDHLWDYRLEGVATLPAVADDRIYVHTIDSDSDYTRVYALEESPFQFSGFAPAKTIVEPGEQFTVDVTIENDDDEIRDYNLSLQADMPYPRGNPVLGWKNGTLGPGNQTTLTFTTKLHSAASWNLSIRRLLETTPSVGPVTVNVVHPNPDDQWSMDGFDANRSDANPNTDGPSQYFQQAWNVSNVDDDTTPVVDNGTVYAIRHQNRYNGLVDIHAVSALDLDTGTQHWEYNFTADNRIPTGSPAVANDTVYVVTRPYQFDSSGPSIEHGSVYAFDATTGNRTWKTSVSINKSSQYDHGPVVANGLVYTAGAIYEQNDYYVNASVVALDAATGGLVWSNGMADRSEQESYGTYALGEQHLFVTALNQIEYASSEYDDDLYAYDATSGSLAWTTASMNLVVDQKETPVVSDGLVFVVNESKNVDGDPAEELVALNVSTGAEEWRFSPPDVPNYYGGDSWRLVKPTVSNGSLFLRQRAYSDTSYSRLHRVDVTTGNTTWNGSTNYLQHVQVVDGIVYGGETEFSSGYIRLYDAETGEKHGDSMGRISVAVANGTVLTYEPGDDRMEAVVEGGIIEFTDLSVDTHHISELENVTVTATATNVGDIPRKYTVNLDVAPDDHSDRYFWDSRERRGTLAAGENTTLSWNVRLDTRGDFVFFLEEGTNNNLLDQYEHDDAGSVMVHVEDDRDGQVVDLGGPRTIAPDTSSWPKESFDAGNTGNASGNSAPTAAGSNTTAWAVNHSKEWTSGPIMANDTVFVGGHTDSGAEAVFAYNATTGSLRWQYATSGDVDVTPTYAGGYLYTADSRNRVYQFNATTGERLWTFDAGGDANGITVVDNVAYVTADYSVYFDGKSTQEDRLYALNATTREILWTLAKPSTSYGLSSPAVENGTVYVTQDGTATYAVDAATGVEQWSRPIAGTSSRLHSPVVADGVVYVDDTTYSGTDANIYALNASDGGSTTWSTPANVDGYTGSSPALANDTLYFTADGAIQAVDATNGNQRWSNQICVAARHSPVYAGGTVFVPMADSTLRAYDATTGDLVWRYEAYGEKSFTPAVVDGLLYTTGLENSDYTYSLLALEGGQTSKATPVFDYSGLSVSSTNVSTGEDFTVSAAVENLGNSPCTYTADFRVDGAIDDTATGTLSSGYSETVSFTHAFSTTGTHTVTIQDLPAVAVNVTEAAADPVVDPSTRDFGDVEVNDYTDRWVKVTNEGTETLYVDGAQIVGTDFSEYSVLSVSQTNVYPGDSATIWIRFEPASSGSKTATLEVETYFEGTVTASLTGTGVGPAEVDVSPTSHDFGDVDVGTNASVNVTVSNVGGSPLSFTGVQHAGDGAFTTVSGNTTTAIAAGGSHNVTVKFEPTTTGSATATFELATNDTDEPTVDVTVLGNGTITTPNRPPVVADDHYTTFEDEWLNVSAPGRLVNDLDPDGDSFIASHYGSPSHGTLSSSTTAGDFEYLPDPGFTGTDSFVYRIRDSEGAYSGYGTVTIEVIPDPNRAPTAIDDQYSIHAGETLTVDAPGKLVNDHDPDNDSFIASHHGNPSNGTLVSSTTAGNFEYVPDAGFTGTDSFVYRIQDEHGAYSSYATVTIDVLPEQNRAPTAVADTYSVSEGETLVVDVPGKLANDYDVDNDSVIASHHGNPSHGTLTSSTTAGNFEYVPDPGFSGTDSFVYRIQDEHGAYSSYATVTIEVAADNRDPVAVADHYATLKGTNLTVSAPGKLANDYDVDNDSFIASHHGNPSNGTLHRSTTAGNFVYEPDAGFTGTDSFVYRIQDDRGTYSSYATVTINVVDPAATDPVAMPDNYTVYEGETLVVDAPGKLANDIDPNGSSIIASHHGNPSNGTLVSSTTAGNFEYEPDPGFTGTDSFVYRIQNDAGDYSSFVPVTIEVLPDPDTTGNRDPTAMDDTYSVFEGETLVVDVPGKLANDYDVDNDSVIASHHGNPSHGTLVSSTTAGNFEYEPDPGFSGTDSFVYRIQDEHGAYSSYATVTIDVIPDPNRAPTAVDDHYAVYAGETLTVDAPGRLVNDRDPDGDSFIASHYGSPSHGTLSSSTTAGDFVYEPDSGFSGTDSFVYRIQDEHGAYSSFATVTIDVLPAPNREPTAMPDTYIILQGSTLDVSAPGKLTNDLDVDGDSFIASHHGNPSNGTLVSSTTAGDFEYQPDADFTGVDSFVYRIQDEHGDYSAFAPVTITVVEGSTSGLADVAVAQNRLDFGTQRLGETESATVTIANIGDENLTFSGATLSGQNASVFDVTAGNETTVLGFGATRTLTVEFTPTDAGEANATLTVHTDDPDEPTVTIDLTGNAIDRTAPTIEPVTVTGRYTSGSTTYTNDTVTIEVTATDPTGSVETVDVELQSTFSSYTRSRAAQYDAGTGNWTVQLDLSTVPDDGTYRIEATARDSARNTNTTTFDERIVLDRASPEMASTLSRINATHARVNVTSVDELRTGTLSVSVDRPNVSTDITVPLTKLSSSWTGVFLLTDDGQYVVNTTAVDRGGNHGTDTVRTRFATESTDANNTLTVKMEPSGLFVRFTTNQPVTDTFVTMTESDDPLAPLDAGQSGVNFLNAELGQSLEGNLSEALIGVPVDDTRLPNGTSADDVTIRYHNDTTDTWEYLPTTVQNVTLADGTTDEYWTATVTHFSTYGAVVTDTTAPTVTATTPADGHSFTAGTNTTTLRVEYEDAITGVDPAGVVVLYDDSLVTTDTATTVTSSYVEYDVTSLEDGSSHTLAVTIEDHAGNSVTETISFDVDSAASSNTGGDGGSDSGSPPTTTTPPTTEDDGPVSTTAPSVNVAASADGAFDTSITNARANERNTVTFPSGGLDANGMTLDELGFTATADGNYSFRVSVSEGQPSGTGSLTVDDTVPLVYVNVSHPDVSADQIANATFRFTASRDRLDVTGVSPTDLVVYRFTEGAWTALETSVADTTTESIVLEAQSPGLSVFALAGRQAATEQPTTESPTTEQPTTEQPTTEPPDEGTTSDPATTTHDVSAETPSPTDPAGSSSMAPLLVGLLAILALLGVVLYRRQR